MGFALLIFDSLRLVGGFDSLDRIAEGLVLDLYSWICERLGGGVLLGRVRWMRGGMVV